MSKSLIIMIAAVAILLAFIGIGAFAFLGSDDDGASEAYEAPPLSDDPPMSPSYIDAIDQEVRARQGSEK